MSKVYGAADPALTYTASGFQLTDTAASVLTGVLSRDAGEDVGNYAINQNTLASNANYTISYTGNDLEITSAILTAGTNLELFAQVLDNHFEYNPGTFWHLSPNPYHGDPGFDVMWGTSDWNTHEEHSYENFWYTSPYLYEGDRGFDVMKGNFHETWSFPQQFETDTKK